jgi:hypothetical protein
MSQHHDPVHPDSGHLTAEVLADLDEGLLDEASEQHARHHLDHCAECRARHGDLASLTETLRALGEQHGEQQGEHPGEEMPAEVWNQISSALASEPVSTPEGSATVVPMQPGRTRRFGRPGIGLVAGIAGVALVGAIVVPWLRSENSASMNDGAADAAAAPSVTRSPLPQDFLATRSGTRYNPDSLGPQVNQLVADRVKLFDTQRNGYAQEDGSASPSGTQRATPESTSAPNPSADNTVTSAGVGGQLARLLRKAGPMATSPAAAQQCLESYLDVSDEVPLAVDIGLWQGKPAAVIVLPLSDPTLVEVWVINPTCDTSNGQDPTYYFATLSR